MEPINDPAFDAWARKAGLVAVYAHGSVVRGTAVPGSDLDLALLFEERPPDWVTEEKVSEEASRRLKSLMGTAREVDVRVLNGAPPAFQFRVVRDRGLLWVGNPPARIDFETRLLSEYLDYRHYEDQHYQAMRTRIQEGRYGRRPAIHRPTSG